MENTTNLTTISSPDQAVSELLGDQYVSWLADYSRKEAESFTKQLNGMGAVADIAHLRRFLLQVYAAERAMWNTSDDSPGFLTFAVANLSECQDPSAEHALETLQKIGSVDIWAQEWSKLFQALGLRPEDFSRIEPKEITRNYIADLSEVYSTAEWQEAVGAFVGQWLVLSHKFLVIHEFAQKTEGVNLKDLEVLKSLSNQETRGYQIASELLERLSFAQESKDLVFKGVARAIEIERDFFQNVIRYLESAE